MSESKELAERLRADLLGEIAWEDDPKSLIDVLNAHRAEAADLVGRQAAIIEALVELFVDTTTVANPEQERVVIEARALTKQ